MNQIVKLKRTTTPNNPPASLAEGELAVGLADDPIRMWIGTATGVKRLFAGEAVEDAPDDAVYGRCNGEWVKQPIIADEPPADPAPNTLWWDSSNGKSYVWYDDRQWVGVAAPGVAGPEGPQGATGPIGATGPEGQQGLVDEAPEDGLMYGRKDGAWAEVVGEIEEAPQDGQTYGREDGAWTPIAATPACGRFRLVNNTTVGFFPYQGDAIKIAGRIYKIPAGGITVTNAGLAASTSYYVYAYHVGGGNLALEFSGTGHETDATPGNVGVEVKQADNSRTLVGMVCTWNDVSFRDQTTARLVASWFNRQSKDLHCSIGAASVAGPGGQVWATGNSALVNVVCWVDEVVGLWALGQVQCAAAGDHLQVMIGRDSTGAAQGAPHYAYNNLHMSITVGGFNNLSEGYHHFGLLLAAQGTALASSWNWQMTGTTRG